MSPSPFDAYDAKAKERKAEQAKEIETETARISAMTVGQHLHKAAVIQATPASSDQDHASLMLAAQNHLLWALAKSQPGRSPEPLTPPARNEHFPLFPAA